ncbi:hypothetical protein, partial [Chitinophaga agrisoli]|uniref:hypothetical protein n=1 Tax=Chitinophaga agrisoli TaxID=2607653 RepID=UPI001BC9AA1D
ELNFGSPPRILELMDAPVLLSVYQRHETANMADFHGREWAEVLVANDALLYNLTCSGHYFVRGLLTQNGLNLLKSVFVKFL